MALQKVVRNMLNTGVSDSSDATAITIDSSENVTFAGTVALGDNKNLLLGASADLGIKHDGSNSKIENNTGHLFFINEADDKDIIFQGDDGGGNLITALTLDISEAGQATFNSGIQFGGGLTSPSGSNINIFSGDGSASSVINLGTSSATRLHIANDGNIGIGTSSPNAKLDILGTTSDQLRLRTAESEEYKIGRNSSTGLLDFHGTQSGYTGYTFGGVDGTRMTIDSSGKVGIGMTPTHQLSVVGISTATSINLGNVGASFPDTLGMFVSSTAHTQTAYGDLNIKARTDYGGYYGIGFFTASSNSTPVLRQKIDSAGNVLIGTSSIVDTNCTALHTKATASTKWVQAMSGVDRGMVKYTTATSGTVLYDYYIYNGSVVGSISSAGSSTAYNTTSDERLKKNIVNASPQLDILKNIKVREFDWKRNDHHELGLIAQEIKDIIPNVVQQGGDDETKNPYGVDYGKLTPYLIKAIQEQQTIIEDLKSRVETLEG